MFISNKLGLTESVETILAQERRMDQVANNVANVDTSGFKREHVTFWEMLYRANDNRLRVGKGVKPLTDFVSGPAETTGNPLDVAIHGDGFFRVQTPDGVRYTRAGNFVLNEQGQMAMPNGSLLLGDGGTIVLNDEKVEIALDGRVFQDDSLIDQLSVVTFADLTALEREGTNLFRLKEGESQEEAAEEFEIRQGFLEGSNTQSIVEMTEMIDLYRAYETQQRAVRALDEIDGQAVQRVGRLTG